MNHAPFPGWRQALRLAAATALVLLLAGCGPGVGGSGTGIEPDVPPGTTATPPALVRHADMVDGRQVQTVLEGVRLDVQVACPHLRFIGLWDGLPGATLRYDGWLDGEPLRRASAEVQISGSTLVLTLRDASGAVLVGPVPLGAVPAQVPLGRCGG